MLVNSERATSRLLIAFKLLLLAFFVASTNHRLGTRFSHLWSESDVLALLVVLVIWALALVGLVVASLLPKFWMRLCWAIPIALSTFWGEFFFSITGFQLSFYDAVLYWAEQAHWGDALEVYSTWLWRPALLAGVGLLALLLPPRAELPRPHLLFFAPFAPILVISALLLHQGGKGTTGLPDQFAPLSMVSVLGLINPLIDEGTSRQPVRMEPTKQAAVDHVFLVVDESVRADFLDLNRDRGTTPFLLSQQDVLANFGRAVSANNCSLFSNLALRFGARPERLSESLRSGPSIWSFAHAAGFTTVYIDTQRRGGALNNGMTLVERSEVDEFVQFEDVTETELDLAVAARLAQIARAPGRYFVYVNKWGNHFPYARNYPEDAEWFAPDMEAGAALGEDRERLVNSYKNSVRWTVDGFFRELLAADLSTSALLYTSDHGQNLMDRGIVLGCDSNDPHVFEGLVPMLAVSGDPALLERFREAAEWNRDRVTHFEIFPTLLELFGFDPSQVSAAYGPGLVDRLEQRPRSFSFGPILGVPGAEIRWKQMPTDFESLEVSRGGGSARTR